MALTLREQQEKELKTVLGKDIGSKNPIFTAQHIADLHLLFCVYADPRYRRADIRDILMTAKILGLDSKQQLVYKALEKICDSVGSDAMDFETFLRLLTAKIGNPFNEEGRRSTFQLMDIEEKGELNIDDMRYISDQLGYGYSDDQLWEIIHSVGGYGAVTITAEKFNKYIEKKVSKRKMLG